MKRLILLLMIITECWSSIDVLFSPDDTPATTLVSEIERTKTPIYAAVYYLSHRDIAKALINAHERGVDVQIITDGETALSRWSKVKQLIKHNVAVYVPSKSMVTPGKKRSLMHDKFALINNKVWTGSFNWTTSANIYNYENVLFIDDEKTYRTYKKRFYQLKEDSLLIKDMSQLEPETAESGSPNDPNNRFISVGISS
jgi:phosphatidylserine/phosphatidylglycerophosphate/cardiolipin synthase-like enzyme